ncbi:MAG: 2-C-methyl-D-erythritol 4-phosphate cytidylyltransferase [Gemmatimonadales bacterium]
MPRDVGVIVVAAGRGSRIGGELLKQYQPIAGVPMVLRALRPFTAHAEVAQVALVIPAEDARQPPGFLAGLAGPGLTLVAGGEARRDSVAAGLAALRPECTIVLVHDAARPFVASGVVDAVIHHARRGEGAIAAVPVTDTLKQTSAEAPDLIQRTVPRERLWRAQTPQGFPREVLTRAHAATAPEICATDDAALVEALGVAVHLVPDSPRNLKITTPDDLALAELLARASM